MCGGSIKDQQFAYSLQEWRIQGKRCMAWAMLDRYWSLLSNKNHGRSKDLLWDAGPPPPESFLCCQIGFLPESYTSHPRSPPIQIVLVFKLWELGFDNPKSKRKHLKIQATGSLKPGKAVKLHRVKEKMHPLRHPAWPRVPAKRSPPIISLRLT